MPQAFHCTDALNIYVYLLFPFLSARSILFLQMQLKYHLFLKSSYQFTTETIYFGISLKYYCNSFSLLFTYLSLPLTYEFLTQWPSLISLRIPGIIQRKKCRPTRNTCWKMDFYFQNSILVSEFTLCSCFTTLAEKSTSLDHISEDSRSLSYVPIRPRHQGISPMTENVSGAQCHHPH